MIKALKNTIRSIFSKIKATHLGGYLSTLFGEIKRDRLAELTSSMTYYLLLALFPFLIFLLGVLSYTPLSISDVTVALTTVMPTDTVDMVLGIVQEILDDENTALFSIAMIGTIWSTTKGAKALIKGVNRAYGVKETRSFLVTRAMGVFVIVGIALFALMSFLLIVLGELLLRQFTVWFDLPVSIQSLISILRFVVPLLMLICYFTLFYLFVPNLRLSFRKVLVGATFTTIGWIALSTLFSYYVSNFANYTRVYGSLGSIIALLLWINLSSMIILIGAEINMLVDWRGKGSSDIVKTDEEN